MFENKCSRDLPWKGPAAETRKRSPLQYSGSSHMASTFMSSWSSHERGKCESMLSTSLHLKKTIEEEVKVEDGGFCVYLPRYIRVSVSLKTVCLVASLVYCVDKRVCAFFWVSFRVPYSGKLVKKNG